MELTIQHSEQDKKFFSIIDGHEAHIEYSLDGDTMNVLHTIVPPALGGQGIAGKLTHHVLNYAKTQGLTINPVCTYTQAYLKKHPEEKL